MKLSSAICFLIISNFIYGTLGSGIWNIFGYHRSEDNKVSKAITYEIPCGVSKYQISERIVGGHKAEPNEFPWLISLQLKINNTYYHNCGGTIVHSKYILTAGHCVQKVDPNNLLVVAGKYNLAIQEEHEQKRGVEKILRNKYNPSSMDHDFALIKLNESLKLEPSYVVPGCLPTGYENFTDNAILAGWGLLKQEGTLPNELMKVILPVLKPDVCISMYKPRGLGPYLHDCQICTLDNNGKDACQGDSGGPLMCITEDEKELFICGIVSWGLGCAQVNNPGVFTKVSCYTDWIVDIINSDSN